MSALVDRVNYQADYLDDYDTFFERIINKTCVPTQLELQPGREKGRALCWMDCPYCYGGKATNDGVRLPISRYLEILKEISNGPHGNIKKVIIAGYATDPLNYEHIDKLLESTILFKNIFGIHTKLLKISEKFINLISGNEINKKSYITVSLDAGYNESYNITHGIKSKAKVLSKIYNNIEAIMKKKSKNIDVGGTYLITKANVSENEIKQSIKDVNDLGIQTLRFSFPQTPRGYDLDAKEDIIFKERDEAKKMLKNLISNLKSDTKVSFVDPDEDYQIDKERMLPCYARFVHPAIGFDGYLYHCSESSSPDFHDMSLGNLHKSSFWESYYSYDIDKLHEDFKKMEKNKCMCDRKLFIVNKKFGNRL